MFKSQKNGNGNGVWGMIKSEQERILSEVRLSSSKFALFLTELIMRQHTGLDQWELLACLQALLFYSLLRLHGEAVEQNGIDAAVQHTIGVGCI